MALINCPECGNRVSDKASVCPKCGVPLHDRMVTGGGRLNDETLSDVQRRTRQGRDSQSELKVYSLKCPYCNSPIGSKDLRSKDFGKCPHCGEEFNIGGNEASYDLDLVVERLAKFEQTKEHLHKLFMQHLMDNANVDVFDNLKLISQKRKYFWTHMFGKAENSALFPMCDYGKRCFERLFGSPYMHQRDYETYFKMDQMVNFNNEDVRDTELIAKEQSASENVCDFSRCSQVGHYAPTRYYYCLPVIEEIVEYNGTQYTFVGTASGPRIRYSVGNFPTAEIFQQSPKYTNKSPVTILTFGIIFTLVVVIAIAILINEGFWVGLICLIILGVIGYFVGLIACIPILAVTASADALLRAGINQQRRARFRKRWQEHQEHKRLAAQKNFRLDLTYEVPEFPVP